MTTMAQFATALQDREFPVTWANNFANYGLPLPIFAHQLPAYLGAFLILAGFSVVGAYNFLMFLAVFLSSLAFYYFLRQHTNSRQALLLTLLMNFFPYRIHNIYVRGALPELLASVFLPLILLSIHYFNIKKRKFALITLLFSIFFLAIAHPMMLFIFVLPAAIYFFLTINKKDIKKQLLWTTSAVILSLSMASFYLLPLLTEVKYFYQGSNQARINPANFFTLNNFLSNYWPYFYAHPGPRGNFLQFGLLEFIVVLFSVLVIFVELLHNKFKNLKTYFLKNKFALGQLFLIILTIFLLTKYSQIIYEKIPGFANLQYPWRFLVLLQFSIPFLFLFIFKKIKILNNFYLQILIVTLLLLMRVPQLYGKNYVKLPENKFYFNQANLHSQNFNTVWSANSLSYQKKSIQAALIEGDGELSIIEVKNASRHYKLIAKTPVRLLDYTFYFPVWQVLANGQAVDIEFQDSDYRGLITYRLPEGEYDLNLDYRPSIIRKIANTFSLLAFFTLFPWLYYLFKKNTFFNKKNL